MNDQDKRQDRILTLLFCLLAAGLAAFLIFT